MPTDITVRDVPIVIEPGVEVIEASVYVTDSDTGTRAFPVQLFRLILDGSVLRKLPFVPSTTTPHVFSPVASVKESTLLLVYDHTGRLTDLYKRTNKYSWSKHEMFDEHAGRTTVVPSVRFRFQNEKVRRRFLSLADKIVKQATSDIIDCDVIHEFARILSRLRTPPVSVPVAILNGDEVNETQSG